MSAPLAIDLYCGLGGWTEGLLAEGYRVVGFDIERHQYGEAKYPAQLVIQDVLTLHGSQFKDAALIVASPPCQEFSYMAMPWTLAKEKQRLIERDPTEQKRLTALFDACFRIQREACEAAGRHIPLVVENVKGAQRWVGRASWHFGSFYLWGDIPALMPITVGRSVMKAGIAHRSDGSTNFHGDKNYGVKIPMPPNGDSLKVGFQQTAHKRISEQWRSKAGQTNEGLKLGPSPGKRWEDRPPNVAAHREGTKNGGDWFNGSEPSAQRRHGSKSNARKAASAMIAKIPFVLARHIARSWKPEVASK